MDSLQKALEIYADKIIADAKRNLRPKNSSGRLASSMVSKFTDDYSIAIWMQDYGPYVDEGRDGTEQRQRNKSSVFWIGGNRGDEPPVDSIKKWIRQKGITPNNGQSVDSLAYVIGQKIAKKGIKGSLFFTNAVNKNETKFEEQLLTAYTEDEDNDIDKFFDDKDDFKNIKVT